MTKSQRISEGDVRDFQTPSRIDSELVHRLGRYSMLQLGKALPVSARRRFVSAGVELLELRAQPSANAGASSGRQRIRSTERRREWRIPLESSAEEMLFPAWQSVRSRGNKHDALGLCQARRRIVTIQIDCRLIKRQIFRAVSCFDRLGDQPGSSQDSVLREVGQVVIEL